MTINNAVNTMLRYIGEPPVPDNVSIDDLDTFHEAYTARDILLTLSAELQQRGWWFNRDTIELVPDYSKNIPIPEVFLSIEPTDGSDYVVRNKQLYDKENQTFIFEDNVEVDVVIELDFDDLPLVFATWVVYSASRQLQNVYNGDDIIDKNLLNMENRQSIIVQKEEVKRSNINLISGTRLVNRTSYPTGVS